LSLEVARAWPVAASPSARGGTKNAAVRARLDTTGNDHAEARDPDHGERSIMKQTGHRSVTVVRRYIRDAELFDDNAAAGIGL
jgi:hypothetical protein